MDAEKNFRLMIVAAAVTVVVISWGESWRIGLAFFLGFALLGWLVQWRKARRR